MPCHSTLSLIWSNSYDIWMSMVVKSFPFITVSLYD